MALFRGMGHGEALAVELTLGESGIVDERTHVVRHSWGFVWTKFRRYSSQS